VGVNDTLGYERSKEFILTVIPVTATPTDTTPTTTDGIPPPISIELIVIAGGVVLVILVLVIWKSKK
jgi:hypothetical protein